MTRVTIANEVVINREASKIENTDNYGYYHPACWKRIQEKLIKSPVGSSYGVAEIETDDPEIIGQDCDKCELPLMGDAPNYSKYRYKRG